MGHTELEWDLKPVSGALQEMEERDSDTGSQGQRTFVNGSEIELMQLSAQGYWATNRS